ncbi:hypothetical protein ACFQV2_38875 [Actinokineospora soli]|uniref:Uncharacterized protein n=1 Tax=Actinokineospora soli TaxID=1048753 RepID=A0ABW2TZV5_9PSEU
MADPDPSWSPDPAAVGVAWALCAAAVTAAALVDDPAAGCCWASRPCCCSCWRCSARSPARGCPPTTRA